GRDGRWQQHRRIRPGPSFTVNDRWAFSRRARGDAVDRRRLSARADLRRDPRAQVRSVRDLERLDRRGIVLWAILGAVGQRTGAYYTAVQELADKQGDASEQEVMTRLRAPTGAVLHLATLAVFVLLVLDMIFKPGA